jgi:hypothetical protein
VDSIVPKHLNAPDEFRRRQNNHFMGHLKSNSAQDKDVRPYLLFDYFYTQFQLFKVCHGEWNTLGRQMNGEWGDVWKTVVLEFIGYYNDYRNSSKRTE